MNEVVENETEETIDEHETEAAKYGWKPPEEFKGEGDHMTAEAFMTRGPGTSRKALERVDELEKQRASDRADYASRMDRIESANKANMDARVEARATEIAQKKREAADSGDMEKYDELAEAETKANGKDSKDETDPVVKAAVEAWMPDNPWFQEDPVANGEAISYYNAFTARGATPTEALKKVSERIKLSRPWLFPEEQKTRKKASVDGGGLASRGTGKKAWADIPAEDRQMVKRQIEGGDWDVLAKTMKITAQEAYASKYWEQDNG